jgi:hypothetical protein
MSLAVAVSRPLKIAKFFTDLTWWLGVVGSVVLTLGFLSSFFGVAFSLSAPVRVEVKAKSADLWSLTAPNSTDGAEPRLDEVHGQLKLRGAPRNVQWIITTSSIAAVLVAMYGLYLFRSLLKDVINRDIFTDRNAARLSRLGWLMIVVAFVGPVWNGWLGSLILDYVGNERFVLQPDSSATGGFLFMGILTLVLAEIWRYGVELQHDRDETV